MNQKDIGTKITTALEEAGLPVAPSTGISLSCYYILPGILLSLFGCSGVQSSHYFESEAELYAFLRGLRLGSQGGSRVFIEHCTRTQDWLKTGVWYNYSNWRARLANLYSHALNILLPERLRDYLWQRLARPRIRQAI